MKEQIIEHFIAIEDKDYDNAFESFNSNEVYLIDKEDNEPLKIIAEREKAHFTISNPNKEELNVVKIDGCLISNNTETRCDGAFYNGKQFVFIEIKAVAKNNKNAAKRKAYKQLEAMINKFKKLNFQDRELYAVIGFPLPKFPIINSKSNTQKSKFKDDFRSKYGHSFELMEGHIFELM